MALGQLGIKQESSLTPAVESHELTYLKAIYDNCRDEVLVMHNWNFATKKTLIDAEDTQDVTSITFVTTTATVTLTSHGYNTGQFVKIEDATPATYNLTKPITKIDANSFSYTLDETPTSNASGSITARLVPGFEFDYMFVLPSDYLRIWEVDEGTIDFKVQGDYIQASVDPIDVEYVWQQTDDTKFSIGFARALGTYLAFRAQKKIGGSKFKVSYKEFMSDLNEAMFQDATEGRHRSERQKPLASSDNAWQQR